MADDLEGFVRSTAGEQPSPEFVAALHQQIVNETEQQRSQVGYEDPVVSVVDLGPEPEERLMTAGRWILLTAAAVVAVLVGAAGLLSGSDTSGVGTVDPAERTSAVDAAAGCGLDTTATVASSIEIAGEEVRVTFDVTSNSACSDVAVRVEANPEAEGIPIVKNLTLDETGAASVTVQLAGSRKVEQDWNVELIVNDTGGVAATNEFTVGEFCDLEATADLQVTYLPATNAVNIVLTVDPLCAGAPFAFDRDNLLASSPAGGWETYITDETGRIDITEQLTAKATGPFLTISAIPAPEERGAIGGAVATTTIDISQ